MRKRSAILIGLLFSFILSTSLVHAPVATAELAYQPPDGYAQQALALLLDARRAAGLPDPQLDLLLVDLASQRSADMANRGYFGHVTPEGTMVFDLLVASGTPWLYASETLQRNNYPAEQSADEAVRSLLASPPHRAIIMDPQYTAVGIGHAVDAQGMHYYTVLWVNR